MTVFFIADTLFGDGAASSRRGLASPEAAKEIMIQRWNAVVTPNDRVYILGGFSIEKPKLIRETMKRLHGEKVMGAYLPEDYDKRGSIKYIYWLMDDIDHIASIIASIITKYLYIAPIDAQKKYSVFAHNNPNYLSTEQRKGILNTQRKALKSPDMKEILLYGGIPGVAGRTTAVAARVDDDGYAINVSCDNWAFRQTPVSDEQLMDIAAHLETLHKTAKKAA